MRPRQEEGIVPGGGVAFVNAIPVKYVEDLSGDEDGSEYNYESLGRTCQTNRGKCGFEGSVVVVRK